MILDSCDPPIVLAPLAGGPSTPELAAAVSNAGGLGFLASGYLSAAELAARRRRTDELTGRPFGVNLFVPGPAGDAARVRQFAAEMEADVTGIGARLGESRHDDDDWDAKIEYLMGAPVAVVSFTFGIPGEDVIAGLRARGTAGCPGLRGGRAPGRDERRTRRGVGAHRAAAAHHRARGHARCGYGRHRDRPGDRRGAVPGRPGCRPRNGVPRLPGGSDRSGAPVRAAR